MSKGYEWPFLAAWFNLIRPLFVRRIDSNEDFNCGSCGKPVLKRVLFCSVTCLREFDEKTGFFGGEDLARSPAPRKATKARK